MTYDEDPLFEEEYDDEENDEDEEYEDDDYEDEDDEDEDDEDYSPDYGESRLSKFMEDPWPSATFILMLIGFAIILATPSAIWEVWLYLLEGFYFTLILTVVACVFALQTMVRSAGSRMRYAGIFVLLISLIAAAVGFADTMSWVLNGQSILPNLGTPLTTVSVTVLIFGLYSLWLFQRTSSKS
ncbi:MAG: hypothetical protein EAX95_04095 [Candidatus Thorarchaeota archaeon]|nr:hypothetical protein [Candidatus Thorarchaeota archaeon]